MDIMEHSHKGKLDGADGWVDINTFNGTSDEWNKYLHK
jgi:GH25 family lysozyme M1 (1,4-beta-N-acetylmuramidase)